MTLENILVEGLVFGSVFTQAEVFFNASLLWHYRKHKNKVKFPAETKQEDPVRGHSYPIMFALGTLSVPAMHYVMPPIENVAGEIASYAVFGAGVCSVEYVCGKVGLAPWREVYKYLENTIKNSYPKTKNLPITLGNGSVFLPLIPVWGAMGAAVRYLHDILHTMK